jgi:hypothetical protein
MNAGTDYRMTDEDAAQILGVSSLPHDIRVLALKRYAATWGQPALIELFSSMLGMANSVIENCKEHAQDILVTHYGCYPEEAEKINFPTLFGAAAGVKLANANKAKNTCHGCAFRHGTVANQCASTTSDADYCLDGASGDFMCHENLDDAGEPTKICRGYANIRKQRGDAE